MFFSNFTFLLTTSLFIVTTEVRAKKNVPLGAELEFYRFANRIDPDALALLMGPDMTEDPNYRQTPSPDCCYNGGTCHLRTPNTDGGADRWCACPANFTGRWCEVDVDECLLPDACGGEHQECVNTYGSHECRCAEGFVSQDNRCIRRISCRDDPCLNFGDCVDRGEGRVLCQCRLGYSGERCEKRVPECDDSSCIDGDLCVAIPNGFQCVKIP